MNLISFVSNKKNPFSKASRKRKREREREQADILLKNDFHFVRYVMWSQLSHVYKYERSVNSKANATRERKDFPRGCVWRGEKREENTLKGFHVTSLSNFLSICFPNKQMNQMCSFSYFSTTPPYPYQLSSFFSSLFFFALSRH